jgi:hypothetical protein
MTSYSVKSGNSINWSSKITLVDKKLILEWLEEKNKYFYKEDIKKILFELWGEIEEW